jgi:hypothetical protein|uniref:Uncharacterized protein n=1 Tax=Zea mays TaxID=4577 RepID=A0A804QUW0_MAIZE
MLANFISCIILSILRSITKKILILHPSNDVLFALHSYTRKSNPQCSGDRERSMILTTPYMVIIERCNSAKIMHGHLQAPAQVFHQGNVPNFDSKYSKKV